MAHAFLSPSGAPAWLRCNVKPWREMDLPDSSSPDADEGTAAHFLLEQCLDQQVDAKHFTGLRIKVENGETEFHTSGAYPVGPEMTGEVQKALNYIRKIANGATIYPEQQLSIEHITGEEGATGTADAIIMTGRVAHVADLKYGRGVQVFAESNEQLMIYGAAALKEFDFLEEVEALHLHILQPRLDHFESWVIPVKDLNDWVSATRNTADRIMEGPEGLTAVAGEKQCRFCKAKATCDEYREHVLGAVSDQFVDLDKGFVQVSVDQASKLLAQSFGVKPGAVDYIDNGDMGVHFSVKKPSIRPALEVAEANIATVDDSRLATMMDAVDMLEGLAKAVRAEMERRLLLGNFSDARYKLVEGKRGNRAWGDEAAAEAQMKAMRLKVDQMYNFKLISPTQAEALLKAENPRKWAKLESAITQSDGKPSVAPASDKRPALSLAVAEQFEELPPVEDFQSNAALIVEALVSVELDDGSDLV